ncbi:hypothetical protein TSOC_003707 [Tetrabaena socialis]|uniref:MYND-type domain-containing protein n=1 Tax=Tetrabaena socialis TaxID=47790 RepID=A0A2J8AAZ4_9CHLO|nr:hypothetical protein TSOC_003707 [Tetrabaena socialis]|eukprot:PNH09694.1 hypothetical protein TSOC_003707 [Tetrabaena socialis]
MAAYARHAASCCDGARGGTATAAVALRVALLAVPRLADFTTQQNDDPRAWLPLVLELELVPNTTGLLRTMLRAFQPCQGEAASPAQEADAAATYEEARSVWSVLQVLEACAGVANALQAAASNDDRDAGSRLPLPINTLLKQLAADDVVQAAALVPPFVQRKLWPLVAASGGGEAPVPQPDRHRCAAAAFNNIYVLIPQSEGVACCGVLTTTARYAFLLLSALSAAAPRGVPGAARALQRVLGAMSASGLAASLGAALLAAPPWREAAAGGAPALDGYAASILMAQRAVVNVVQRVTRCVATSARDAALGALAAPEVLRLQWELLVQVAAAAQQGAERGGGSALAAGRQRWPMLQQLALARVCEGSVLLADSLYDCVVSGAYAPWVMGTRSPLSDVRAVVAAAERLLPCRASGAALAARVVASLSAHAQRLGPAGAVSVGEGHVGGGGLVECALALQRLVLFRMRGAPQAELEACLPDLLAMLAWFAGMVATPAGLAPGQEEATVQPSCMLASCVLGWASRTDLLRPIDEINVCPADAQAVFWLSLRAGVRAACVQRLQPTGLARSLERLLRRSASRGLRLEGVCGVGMLLSPPLTYLLGPLLRAPLVQLRVQLQMQQQQQQRRRAPPDAGSGAGGGGEGSGVWRAREELALVLTALKLLRLEASRRGEPRVDGEPELLSKGEVPLFGLALFVAQLGCGDQGLVSMIPELMACVALADAAPGGQGADGCADGGGVRGDERDPARAAAPGAADVCLVAQAVAACGTAVLPVLTQLLEQAADWLEREAAPGAGLSGNARRADGGGSGGAAAPTKRKVVQIAMRCDVAAATALSAIRHLPAEVLLAVAPQRALAAVARLLRLLLQQPQGRDAELEAVTESAMVSVAEAVLLLSTEELLLEGCVPGWLWVGAGRPGAPEGWAGAGLVDVDALAAVQGPSYAPQQGPVIETSSGTAVTLGSLRWEDHRQHRAEVAALAGARAQELGLLGGRVWQVVAAVPGGQALWPPRLLRLCDNPGCGNFGDACGKLLKCSRCVGVRYCGAACQAQHWPQHKGECRRLAAAAGGKGGG